MAFGANVDAYQMGWDAYFQNKRNPFRSGSSDGVRFARGYSDARASDAQFRDTLKAY
ncbi:hypothetical protein [Methylobacter sp.]|uniref:hypothetical protein n=1 Tax=Methylobacter sp. TaxID=2051955 RepID=UPI0025DD28C3|nr:hypothetical protein [Methylobacter sp.]